MSDSSPIWPRIRRRLREPLAEFLGTFVLMLLGDGVVAQTLLSGETKGTYLSIPMCWGAGVMLGVYVSGGISGGHLNPAVTFANCVFRRFPWRKLPAYAAAQLLGAFCASLVVYGNYRSAFDHYAGAGVREVTGDRATASIFSTYPAPFLTRTGMVFSEIVASAVLMLGIYAIYDDQNAGAGPLAPLILFFLIFAIGSALGWQTGYAINPARDLGPRIASYMVGYGPQVFTAGGTYFWIPVVCPFIGCTLGGFLYDLLVFTGGESPVNRPYFGLAKRRAVDDEEASDEGPCSEEKYSSN